MARRSGGNGSEAGSANVWNSIVGFRRRIRLGSDTALYIPYYFDAGAGGSKLTWQIASGLSTIQASLVCPLTGRCLSFEQNGGSLQHLAGQGPDDHGEFDVLERDGIDNGLQAGHHHDTTT